MHRPFRYAPPPLGPHTFLRPRLVGTLARRFDLRLIAIEAGAGFGKTTLLTQALDENRLAPAGRDVWLSCDAADGTPSRLLGGLLTALGRPPTLDVLPTVGDVAEAVWSASPESVCLVIDDVHWIDPQSAGMAVLAELVDELPSNASLVLAGRRLPAVGLARLVAAGRAVRFHEPDLALNTAEATQLAERHGADPDILVTMGGWPALAELAAVAGQAIAMRFVEEEILAPLGDEDRFAFLCAVAVGGGDAAVLDAAAAAPVDLGRLARLPLVSFDDQVGIRPHHLWADLLKSSLAAPEIVEARRRAVGVLVAREQFADAFELLAGAGDWAGALDVLVEGCNDQRRPPWGDVLAQWRRSIPAEFVDRPEVIYLDAMIERVADPWSDSCRRSFDRAIDAFRGARQTRRAIGGKIRASYVNWVRGDLAASEQDYQEALAAAERGLSSPAVANVNAACRGDMTGDVGAVREAVANLSGLEARLAHFPGLYLALAELHAGEAARAIGPATAAAAASVPIFPAGGTGFGRIVPLVARWANGEVVATTAPALSDPGERLPLPERAPSLAFAAAVAAHQGDLERATAIHARLLALVRHPESRGLLAASAAVAGATIAAARGDEDGARQILADGLADHPFEAVGAGRIVVWLPAVPYLFHDRARAWLDALPSGPSRRRTLAAARALRALRAGERPEHVELLDDGDAIVTALPLPQAAELVIGLAAGGDPGAARALRQFVERAPSVTRATLARLAEHADATQRRALTSVKRELAIPPEHIVEITAFGPLTLRRGGAVVEDRDWRRERVRQLLATLVALREVRRARLGALLWPEFDEESVSANLRMTLSYLQALLEPDREKGDPPWFLRQDAGVLALRTDPSLVVDAWEVERQLDAAEAAGRAGTPSVQLAALTAVLDAWRGEYLEDLAGLDWAEPIRRRMQDRLVAAATRAGELLLGAGRPADARAAAERALAAEAWCEPAHRVVIASHLAESDRSRARHAYERCVAAMAELGVAPDSATAILAARAAT